MLHDTHTSYILTILLLLIINVHLQMSILYYIFYMSTFSDSDFITIHAVLMIIRTYTITTICCSNLSVIMIIITTTPVLLTFKLINF